MDIDLDECIAVNFPRKRRIEHFSILKSQVGAMESQRQLSRSLKAEEAAAFDRG